ncbi:hypothetical protein LXL04_007244 [Taraxacum kok-saghyz]
MDEAKYVRDYILGGKFNETHLLPGDFTTGDSLSISVSLSSDGSSTRRRLLQRRRRTAVEAAVQEVSPTSATTHDEAGTSEHQRVEIDR